MRLAGKLVACSAITVLTFLTGTLRCESLRSYLERNGVSSQVLERFFKVVRFSRQVAEKNLFHREKPQNYAYAFTPENIKRIKRFMEKHRKTLGLSEKRFGVPPSVVVSILFLESGFDAEGTKRFRVATALYTIYLLGRAGFVKRFVKRPSPDLVKRLRERSRWARRELAILLSKIRNPLSIYGSWAGAFGICQFVPSSFVRYAVDGNGDGAIDPFNEDDAIMSVASFLRKNGWKRGLTEKRMERVIYKFNHSVPYCRAVMKLHKTITSG